MYIIYKLAFKIQTFFCATTGSVYLGCTPCSEFRGNTYQGLEYYSIHLGCQR